MHLKGPAELWYQNFKEDLDKLQWEDFIRELVTRFNSQPYENVEGEFSKLIQTSTVAEYQERFEELRAIVKIENQGLSEKIYINSFIIGLKEEIKHQVHMFFPKTLTQAFSIARIQESNLQSQFKSTPITIFHTKPNTTTYNSSPINKANISSENSTPSINSYHKPINHSSTTNESKPMSFLPTKRLNQAKMQERREKGLCYNCYEVYKYGHRCKRLSMISGISEEEDETREEWLEAKESHDREDEEIQISVHALVGQTSLDTIQLWAFLRILN